MPLTEVRDELLREQSVQELLVEGKSSKGGLSAPKPLLPHTRATSSDWQENIALIQQELAVLDRALDQAEQELTPTTEWKLPRGVDIARSGSLIRPDRGEATLPLMAAFGIQVMVEFAHPGEVTAVGELNDITTPLGVCLQGRRDPVVLRVKLPATYPVTTITLTGEGAKLLVGEEEIPGGPIWHLPGAEVTAFQLVLTIPPGEIRKFSNLAVFSEQFSSVGTLYSQRFSLGAEVSQIKLNLTHSYGPYTSLRAELVLPTRKISAPPGSWVSLGTVKRQQEVLTAQAENERRFAFGQERVRLGALGACPAKVWRVRLGAGQVAAVDLQGEDLELAAREFRGSRQLVSASSPQVTVPGPRAFRCEWVPTAGDVSLLLPAKSFLLVDDQRVEGIAGFAAVEGPRELTLVYTEAGTYPFPLASLADELQVALFRALPWESADLWRGVAVADDLSVWLAADDFLPGLQVELDYTPWQPPQEAYYTVQLARGSNIYTTPAVTDISWEVK